MPAEPAAPVHRRIPLWLLVPAALLGLVALLVVAVTRSVSVADECARAERLIASFDGDPKVLFEAQARLKLLLVTHPFSSRGWATASHLARVAGDPGDGTLNPKALALAHDAARKAIRFGAGDCSGYVAEGWAYASAQDWILAGEEARKADATAPGDPRVRVLAAAVAAAEHRPAEALRGFEVALTDARADSVLRADAWQRLAVVYTALDLAEAADSCWCAAAAQAPRATRVRERYTRFLTAHGRHDRAVAEAESLVALVDNAGTREARAGAHVGRGVWWIESRHQPGEALRDFEQANADQPEDPGIWYDIALAHVGLFREGAAPDERAAAHQAIAKARRLAPGDEDVRALEAIVVSLDASGAH
jgi:tetratricopeptide (TPR) repeat protein